MRKIDRQRLEAGAYKFDAAGDARQRPRVSQRELAHVAVSVLGPDGGTWQTGRLWDFNALSFGILVGAGGWEIGRRIVVRLGSVRGAFLEAACILVDKREIAGAPAPAWRLGLRRDDIEAPRGSDAGGRGDEPRFPIRPDGIAARIRHPFLFAHWCRVRAYEAHRDLGFGLEGEDPSLLVFVGMKLDLHFDLSGTSGRPMTAEVTWVRAADAGRVRFGVACLAADLGLHDRIGEHLFRFGHWPPARLLEAGYRNLSLRRQLDFRDADGREDIDAVRRLRLVCDPEPEGRSAGGRSGDQAGDQAGESAVDPGVGARILTAWHGVELVGSFAIGLPGSEVMEVSRIYIHPGYLDSDLLLGLLEQALRVLLSSGRGWMRVSIGPGQLPLFLALGFRAVDGRHPPSSPDGGGGCLVQARLEVFLLGKGMRRFVWLERFGDVLQYLVRSHPRLFPRAVRLRLRFLLLLHPLARRLAQGRSRRAFYRRLAEARAGFRAPVPLSAVRAA